MAERMRGGDTATIMLALFIAMLGIEIGAGLYEARVVVPLWTADPQAAFAFHKAHPAFAERAGQRFWMVSTPLCGLLGLATGLLAGRLPRPSRNLARCAGFGLAILTVITFVFFVPELMQLQGKAVTAMAAAEAKARGARWAAFNWLRAAVALTGLALALAALVRRTDA